jgi:hypothetical protein
MIKLFSKLLLHRSRHIVESIYRVVSVERVNSTDGDETCLGVLPTVCNRREVKKSARMSYSKIKSQLICFFYVEQKLI